MAKLTLKKAATDVTVYLFAQASNVTTGAGLTGLAYNTASLTAYYVRPLGSAAAITLATQTVTGAHSDGGFVEVDATNMPGVYRLDLPDAVCATGVPSAVVMLKGAANLAPVLLEIQLTDFDLNTAGVTLADDAITAAKFDESTAYPLKSADTGSTQVARVGADSDTLETLSDQIDGAALEATLTAIKGAGWTNETLGGIYSLIVALSAGDDLGTVLSAIDSLKGVGWTNETLVKIVTDIAAISAGSGATAQEVWEYATRVLTAGTNIDLSALATAANLAILDGKVDTADAVADAIKLKTDLIPASPAEAGEYTAAIGAIPTAPLLAANYTAPDNAGIAAIKTVVDDLHNTDLPAVKTETTAIKAKTDNLPANTATALAAIQSDLDNPAQYKADVSGLAPANEYDAEFTAIQADLDNPDQYKADVSALATQESVNAIPTTPLLAANYTAPDNAGIGAIKAKTDQLTFTTLNKVDASATIDPTGIATSEELEVIGEKVDNVLDKLNVSSVEFVTSVVGSTITILRGDTLTASLLNLGSMESYVSLDFTVKRNTSNTDDEAVIRIRKNASGLTDGLLRLNGAAHTTGTDGSITINDAPTGDITIMLKAGVTDDLVPGTYVYDIQLIEAAEVKTLTSGRLNVTSDVTRAIA